MKSTPLVVIILLVLGQTCFWCACGTRITPSEANAAFAQIAFTLRDNNGRLQIFTESLDGSHQQQLTSGQYNNGDANWSPDGSQIAFASDRNGVGWVGVMNADGSNQQMLVGEATKPNWSPDGKQLAFERPDGQIWVMNADGSNVTQITQSDTFKAGPSWSPDGKQMVYILLLNPGSPTDPQPQIGIMNSDGTNQRILTTQDRDNLCLEADGIEVFNSTAHDANAPEWSSVDNRIAMWSGIEEQYGDIWLINSDGTGSTQLTKTCGQINNDGPSWSPDGTKILFSTDRDGRGELWMMDADGSNQHRVSNFDADPFPGQASWRPVQ